MSIYTEYTPTTKYNLYIPNISTYKRWYFDTDVYNLIEVNIGHIERMDFVNVEYIKGQQYVSVYIKLAYWYENKYTEYLKSAIELNCAKIFYDGPYYWSVYKNTSHTFPTKSTDTMELLKVRSDELEKYSIMRFKDNRSSLEYSKDDESDLETIILDMEEDSKTSDAATTEEEIIPATDATFSHEVMNYDIYECRIKCKSRFINTWYPSYKTQQVHPTK